MKKHFFSGIDMSADSFNVCLLKNSPGGSRIDGAFRNTKAGIQKFLTWLRENGVTCDNSTLVVENTGVYDDLFIYLLQRKGWTVCLLPTTALKRVSPEHRKKTDEYDAFKLAEYAFRFQDTLKPAPVADAEIEQLRVLYQTRQTLVGDRSRLLAYQKQMKRLIVASKIAVVSIETSLKFLTAQILKLERAMWAHIRRHKHIQRRYDLLKSVPGVGKLTGVLLLTLFWNKEKLDIKQVASWFGIAPHPRQSGTSLLSKPRTGKTGRKDARSMLKMGTRSVMQTEPDIILYKEQKLKEGKHIRVIENNVANKIVRGVCGVWNSNEPCRFGWENAA